MLIDNLDFGKNISNRILAEIFSIPYYIPMYPVESKRSSKNIVNAVKSSASKRLLAKN